MPVPAPAYARVAAGGARVGARVRANTTLLAGCQGLARRGCGADTTNDLKGLERAFAYGLYAGLARGFWGPCWPVLGPCWGFAHGVRCWAGAAGLGMPVFTVYPDSAGWLYSTKGMSERMA